MAQDKKLIGELAGELDVNPRTLRYYERIGLLPDPQRSEGRYRLYRPEERERLAFILRAKRLAFSLAEIREILDFRQASDVPCPYVLRQMAGKIEGMSL